MKNVLVFMTDHQPVMTMPPYLKAIAPNIERVFKKGVSFTHAFCPSPHCCPSRASFFTGLYPSRHGVWNNVNVSNCLSRGPFEGTRIFAEDLKAAGYNTYFSGKWHVSNSLRPSDFGFEEIYHKKKYRPDAPGPDNSEWRHYIKTKPDKNGQYDKSRLDEYRAFASVTDRETDEREEAQCIRPGYPRYTQYGVKDNPYDDGAMVDATADFIRNSLPEDKPFFLFCSPTGPHDPYCPPREYIDMYKDIEIELPESFDDDLADKPALYRRTKLAYSQLTREEHRESLRRFLAFCTYEDALFGKLVDALEEKGLWKDTVVMYLSDHGDYAGAHGLWAKGLPCFDEAYRICAMIAGDDITDPGRCEDSLISMVDFAPTVMELCGVRPTLPLSGRSLVPFLKNEKPSDWPDEVYSQSNGNEVYGIQRSYRNRRYKYVFNAFDFDEFYDLEKDPLQMHNIMGPDVMPQVKEAWKKLWKFAWDNDDAIVNPYIMTAFAPFGPGILFENEQD